MKIRKATFRKKRKESQENSESETQEGSSTDTDCDQDSDVSFAEDSDKGVGRLRKRWEDEGNDFFKPEETEATNGSDVKTTTHGYRQQSKRQMERKRR